MYKAIQHCPLCIAKNYFKHYDAVVHTKRKATFARSQKLVFCLCKSRLLYLFFSFCKNDCSPYCSSLL